MEKDEQLRLAHAELEKQQEAHARADWEKQLQLTDIQAELQKKERETTEEL